MEDRVAVKMDERLGSRLVEYVAFYWACRKVESLEVRMAEKMAGT